MRSSARITACLVRAGPIRCSMRGTLCQLMFMPSPISGTRRCALVAITRKSSATASATPPPMQNPSMAAIVTCSISCQARVSRGPSFRCRRKLPISMLRRERPSGSFRSKPALNAFALPVSTTTDVSASSSNDRAAAVSWRNASGDSALMPSPRSNRTTAMRPSGPRPFSIVTKSVTGRSSGSFLQSLSHNAGIEYVPALTRAISTSTWASAYLCAMSSQDHHHDHDHSELSETELRVRALETILTEKGYVEPGALDAIIQAYETKIGPHNGARVVARAWSDPAFKQALIADGSKAIATLGHVSRTGDHLVVVENTPARHNMVVCTLCSCYPCELLGLPPVWYKAAPYRSRAVKDPRGVLADFGVTLPKDIEIRVWDSTAETRFLVLPMRPSGTEGFSEEQLAELVTRDSMIGTGFPKRPGAPS